MVLKQVVEKHASNALSLNTFSLHPSFGEDSFAEYIFALSDVELYK